MATIRIPVTRTYTLKTGSAPVKCVCGRVIGPHQNHTCKKTYR